MNKSLFFLFVLFIGGSASANNGSGEIYVNLQKLHSLKRVLYVAAHPDDENTRALAWFSLGEKAETAYFSLTRGDGGQNLIGNELSEELGVLRTQELLAARSHDGAKQFFSRAVDFGYSKSAKESFELWGKEQLLADLVLMIRKFRPDVIVTRFPPDKRAGHGHHTASALLAIEAFEKAADKNYEKEQVAQYGVWSTTSVYWNTSYWWDENIKDMADGDPNYLITDIGGYNPQLGMSYNEIGTYARSEHKCQGFGGLVERGSRIEYFKHLAGEKLKESFFERNTRTWSDMGDKGLDRAFTTALEQFDFVDVENNVPVIMGILKRLEALPSSYVIDEKIQRCKSILVDCMGLNLEVIGDEFSFTMGDSVTLTANAVNRSSVNLFLNGITFSSGEQVLLTDTLKLNQVYSKEVTSSGTLKIGNPYWLNAPFKSVFEVNNPEDLGQPESAPSIVTTFNLRWEETNFDIDVPVTYKWRDPSYGERRRPMIAAPDFTASFDKKQVLVSPEEEVSVRVKIKSFADSLDATIRINAPKGWRVSPAEMNVSFRSMHAEEWLDFTLVAEENAMQGTLWLSDGANKPLNSYKEIGYDHIPTQALFRKTTLKCAVLDAKINKGKIAYIKGVEDVVPQAIEQLGFDVSVFEVDALPDITLSDYQTVVLGIRIYNVKPELNNFSERLYKYVEDGGNLIMQYNTASRSMRGQKFGPYPFELSRNRVTEEDAEVTFLKPDHPLLNVPNKITKTDFDDWVQERGLYFANNWDENYTPLFSWSDEGDDPQHGALIVANYGKGQFIYTGISFFRELPNGVIGAYRLFANMLSYQR